MSDDRQKEPQSIADALAQADGAEEQEDATVQISRAELAAIRESASNPALTPDVLREINRRREGGAVEDDDATQTFDRDSLSSLLEERSNASAQSSAAADKDLTPTEEFELSDADAPEAADEGEALDDFDVFDGFDSVEDLGEFSDADLHAVVFGDEVPASANEDDSPVLPERQRDEIDLLDDEEFDALEELTDDDDDELPELSTPSSVAEESFPQPPASQPPASQPPAPQPPASQPPVSQTAPTEAPAPNTSQQAPPAPVDLDEPIADFRSPESRLLIVGALVAGVAMLVAGVLRLATSDMLSFLHPALAGLMIAVGVLLLMGLLISFLQGRSH